MWSLVPKTVNPQCAAVNRVHTQFLQVTESGDVCHFPFFHHGRIHSNCVEFGSDRPWCATANLQVDPTAWDYCRPRK